jgi:hypothetical protein
VFESLGCSVADIYGAGWGIPKFRAAYASSADPVRLPNLRVRGIAGMRCLAL